MYKVYRSMIDNMTEGIFLLNVDKKVVFWNKSAEKVTGYSIDDVVDFKCNGKLFSFNQQCKDGNCTDNCPIERCLKDGEVRRHVMQLLHKDGHQLPISIKTIPISENGSIMGLMNYITDHSENTRLNNRIESLKKLALYDELTQLPNRRYLESFIESKIYEYENIGLPLGVAFFDIDHFKSINDTYGHDIGDEVIRVVSKTCSEAIRSSDIIGRWGGDEFILCFVGIDEDGLEVVTEKLRKLIETTPYEHNDKKLNLTISMGATMVKKKDTYVSILKRADELLYVSKEEGRNKVTIDK